MGNTGSASRESSLTTWAMAQYTSLNREQLMDLRDACFHEQKAKRKRRWRRKQNPFENKENEEESSMTSIESDKSSRTSDNKEDSVHVLSRARLKQCLETAGIQPTPDREIICDLHTMWDEHDTDEIPTMAFLVSLCPLACHPTHTSRMFFQFVMDFHDRKETRRLSPCDLMTILESLNMTVLFLGDEALHKRQLKHMVLEMTQSMAMVHQKTVNNEFLLSVDDVVTMLAVDPSIRKLMAQKLNSKHRVSFASHVSIAFIGQWLFADDLYDFSATDMSSISGDDVPSSPQQQQHHHHHHHHQSFGEELGSLFPDAPRPNKAQLLEIANEELLTTSMSPTSAAKEDGGSMKKSSLNSFLNPPKVRAAMSAMLTNRFPRMSKQQQQQQETADDSYYHQDLFPMGVAEL